MLAKHFTWTWGFSFRNIISYENLLLKDYDNIPRYPAFITLIPSIFPIFLLIIFSTVCVMVQWIAVLCVARVLSLSGDWLVWWPVAHGVDTVSCHQGQHQHCQSASPCFITTDIHQWSDKHLLTICGGQSGPSGHVVLVFCFLPQFHHSAPELRRMFVSL